MAKALLQAQPYRQITKEGRIDEMSKIIEVSDLKKSYGNVKAIDGISFYVETGKLFAFLGPNGAGKSTTIDIICTFLKPDSGSAVIDGNVLGDSDGAIRSVIGAVFQDGLLDPLLTVRENLKIRGGFYGLKRTDLEKAIGNAASATGISDFIDRQYGKLSGGQRRRADIARALVNTPKILFLDEPTTGLDPQTRKNVWETVKRLQRDSGVTVFLTTHYMEEAAEADYVIVIDNGKIAAKGTPTELKERYATDLLKLSPADENKLREVMQKNNVEYAETAGRLIIKIAKTTDALSILDLCRDNIKGFEVINGTMDDAFIGITGKEIRQ
jgi:multidrug/hemolysin transport system ATP-binding protein